MEQPVLVKARIRALWTFSLEGTAKRKGDKVNEQLQDVRSHSSRNRSD